MALLPETAGSMQQQHVDKDSICRTACWQGQLSWRWGRKAKTSSSFNTILLSIKTRSSGLKWDDTTGQSSTESCLAFQRQLHFSTRLPACKRDVQEAWSGKVLLLQCPHRQCSPGAVEDKGFDNQQADTASAEALCESLQYSRLSGCLEGTGCALMAQLPSDANPSALACPQAHMDEELKSPALVGDSQLAAVDTAHHHSSAMPCEKTPAVNIVLVAVGDLQNWLPDTVLDEEQLADIAATATAQQAGICALLLAPKANPLPTPPSPVISSASSQRLLSPQLQPLSPQLQPQLPQPLSPQPQPQSPQLQPLSPQPQPLSPRPQPLSQQLQPLSPQLQQHRPETLQLQPSETMTIPQAQLPDVSLEHPLKEVAASTPGDTDASASNVVAQPAVKLAQVLSQLACMTEDAWRPHFLATGLPPTICEKLVQLFTRATSDVSAQSHQMTDSMQQHIEAAAVPELPQQACASMQGQPFPPTVSEATHTGHNAQDEPCDEQHAHCHQSAGLCELSLPCSAAQRAKRLRHTHERNKPLKLERVSKRRRLSHARQLLPADPRKTDTIQMLPTVHLADAVQMAEAQELDLQKLPLSWQQHQQQEQKQQEPHELYERLPPQQQVWQHSRHQHQQYATSDSSPSKQVGNRQQQEQHLHMGQQQEQQLQHHQHQHQHHQQGLSMHQHLLLLQQQYGGMLPDEKLDPLLQLHMSFDTDIIGSLESSISQLGLVRRGSDAEAVASSIKELRTLTKLRILSMLAAADLTGNEKDLTSSLLRQLQDVVTDIRNPAAWTGQRSGPQWQRNFHPGVRKSLNDIIARGLLPPDSVPDLAAEALPVGLQAAYILCLGTHKGSQPIQEFAIDLLRYIAILVYLAVQSVSHGRLDNHPATGSFELVMFMALKPRETAHGIAPMTAGWQTSADLLTAQSSSALDAANEQGHSPMLGDIARVLAVLMALGCLSLTSLHMHSLKTLLELSPEGQMWCLCQFTSHVHSARTPAAVLMSMCKKYEAERGRTTCALFADAKMKREGVQPEMVGQARRLVKEACQCGLLELPRGQSVAQATFANVKHDSPLI